MSEDKKQKKSSKILERTEVKQQGHVLSLPEGMTPQDGIRALQRQIQQDDQEVTLHFPLDCGPLDGAHALKIALAELYGWTANVPTPGFFGPNPPRLIGVDVDFGKKEQVIWGAIAIPNIAGQLETSLTINEGRQVFTITGWTLQKHKKQIDRIVNKTKEVLRERSIYRGKSLEMDFKKINPNIDRQAMDPFYTAPKFIDQSKIDPSSLVLPKEVHDAVNINIFTLIKRKAATDGERVPFKRGVLLHGPFGTGKTLIANITGKYASDRGITFLYIKKVEDLPAALAWMRMYSPGVVFVEDIDSVLSGERTEEMNSYLNTLDGVGFKEQEIMVVATSNNVGKIHPAVLRHGRFDAVIRIPPPDAKASEQLVRKYAGNLIDSNEDLRQVGEELKGSPAAAIRGIVETSKLAMIARIEDEKEFAEANGLPLPEEREKKLTAADLLTTVRASKDHLDMQKPREDEPQKHPVQVISEAVGEGVGRGLGGSLHDIFKNFSDVKQMAENAFEKAEKVVQGSTASNGKKHEDDLERASSAP